jgi:methylthioribulose-1-phosphate dehydratase
MPHPRLAECAAEIARAGRFADARGWTPATSGNLSMRLDDDRLAITESGVAKGTLGVTQIMVVDGGGRPIESKRDPLTRSLEPDRRPSAETALHCEAYQRDASIGAVIHTHSMTSTVLSRALAGAATIELQGFELLKAFSGIGTHATCLTVPLLENDQDTIALARAARAALALLPRSYGYLIRGHGTYVWGRDMTEALRHAEALEFLLACALEERRIRP